VPKLSIYAFASVYLFVPAVLFCSALLLCATDTNLLLKLLFPVVAFFGLPFGYLLYESLGGYVADLGHFTADLGLSLVVTLAPAAFGTSIGLIIYAIKKRQRKQALKRKAARDYTQPMGTSASSSGKNSRTRNQTSVEKDYQALAGPRLRVTPRSQPGANGANGASRTAKTTAAGKASRAGTTRRTTSTGRATAGTPNRRRGPSPRP
jgi:hypothetical protein